MDELINQLKQTTDELQGYRNSWTQMLRLISELSDAMEMSVEPWSEADDMDLNDEFDPWIVVRSARDYFLSLNTEQELEAEELYDLQRRT